MISEKFCIKVGLICLVAAVVGMTLVICGVTWGRYIVYPSVAAGAITIWVGGITVMLRKRKGQNRHKD